MSDNQIRLSAAAPFLRLDSVLHHTLIAQRWNKYIRRFERELTDGTQVRFNRCARSSSDYINTINNYNLSQISSILSNSKEIYIFGSYSYGWQMFKLWK